MTDKRPLKQISVLLYEDQLESLKKLCKLKLFDSQNDYFRQTVDKFLDDNKELLKDK